MKKIYLVFVFFAITAMTFAQLQVNPNATKNRLPLANEAKTPVATLTYCGDVMATSIGMNADAEFGVFVSFPSAMMTPYIGNIINVVPINVTQLANIGSIEIRIFEDTTGAGAGGGTPVATQTVDVLTLIDGWNNITLTTPYSVSGNEIFVGYWIHALAGFPCGASNSTALVDPAGGWVCDPAGWATLNGYGLAYNWQIKAVVDDGAAFDNVTLVELTVPNMICDLTASEEVIATVQNNGSAEITAAFNIGYTVNGGAEVQVPVTVPLAAGAMVDVSFNVDLSIDNVYEIKAYTQLAADSDNDDDTLTSYSANTIPTPIPMTIKFDPMSGDFVGWNAEDVNDDDNTWGVYDMTTAGGGYDDAYACVYFYSATNVGNDYMYSNCIDLTAGDYTLSFWTNTGGYDESLKVFVGEGQDAAAMTQEITDLGTINYEVWTQTVVNFTIATTGTFNLGFFAYSIADQYWVGIDEITLDVASTIATTTVDVINIYPNPSKGFIKVSNANTIVVYNMIGEVVASVNDASGLTTVDLSNLSDGSYIVKANNGTEIITKKINIIK